MANINYIQDEGINLLRFAILRQAVEDWKRNYKIELYEEENNTLNSIPREKSRTAADAYCTRESVEAFLFSPWGQLLSDNRGWDIFDKLVQEYENKTKKRRIRTASNMKTVA